MIDFHQVLTSANKEVQYKYTKLHTNPSIKKKTNYFLFALCMWKLLFPQKKSFMRPAYLDSHIEQICYLSKRRAFIRQGVGGSK